MAHTFSLCGVILAAGESSRMGRDKALLPWPPGESGHGTFLSATIRSLMASCDQVIVVCGENESQIAPVVYSEGAALVRNPAPSEGQFSSLRIGLGEVLQRGRDAAIVTLVDRPPANRETVAQLVEAFDAAMKSGKWAAVPEHEGRHGHPIVIGREMMEAFLRAPATTNAREVEHAHQEKMAYVTVADPFATMNVNTPADYDKLTAR